MNYTFKLKKEDNLYLREFIDELLRVYVSVNISDDEQYYYITLTECTVVLNNNGISFENKVRCFENDSATL